MRRVAQAPFFVLRGAGMPSVLVELGFVTDKAEAKLLLDEAYQKKMADALARGIQGYLKNN
jgi:N-acetylmuramoyl-L-alanine amidase